MGRRNRERIERIREGKEIPIAKASKETSPKVIHPKYPGENPASTS